MRFVSATVTRPAALPFAAASTRASPQITSTLFFFIRKATPSASRFETPRERRTTAPMSNPISLAESPYSPACWKVP